MISQTQSSTAILFACWHDNQNLDGNMFDSMMVEPILNRPILQLVLERIVREGCLDIHVVLGDSPQPVRELLENGERWGCRITYHYMLPEDGIEALMQRLRLEADENYWVVDACSLPEKGWHDGVTLANGDNGYAGFCKGVERTHWCGWASLHGSWLAGISAQCSFDAMESKLLADVSLHRCEVDALLQVRDFTDFLQASAALLKDAARYGLASTLPQSRAEGIYVSRDCSIHEDAVLMPPLFIGTGVKVEAGAILGPDLVVGCNTYIARGAQVSHSCILSDSFIGEQTEFRHVVVKGSHCYHQAYDVSLEIEDAGIISPVQPSLASVLAAWKERVLACFLYIVLSPIYWPLRMVMGVQRQDSIVPFPNRLKNIQQIVVAGVAIPDKNIGTPRALLHHFVATFYPGLISVLRGHLVLFGPRIRSIQDVKALPLEWSRIYQESRCGLLQEAIFADADMQSEELQFVSDLLAGKNKQLIARLLLQYLTCLSREIARWLFLRQASLDEVLHTSNIGLNKNTQHLT